MLNSHDNSSNTLSLICNNIFLYMSITILLCEDMKRSLKSALQRLPEALDAYLLPIYKTKTTGFNCENMLHRRCGVDCRYGSHTAYQIEYHFVWVTKCRFKILGGGVAECVREVGSSECDAFEIRMVQGVVSKDYAHILVSCPPEMAPSETMSTDKGTNIELSG